MFYYTIMYHSILYPIVIYSNIFYYTIRHPVPRCPSLPAPPPSTPIHLLSSCALTQSQGRGCRPEGDDEHCIFSNGICLCNIIVYYTMVYDVLLYHNVPFHIIPYCDILYHILLYHTIPSSQMSLPSCSSSLHPHSPFILMSPPAVARTRVSTRRGR